MTRLVAMQYPLRETTWVSSKLHWALGCPQPRRDWRTTLACASSCTKQENQSNQSTRRTFSQWNPKQISSHQTNPLLFVFGDITKWKFAMNNDSGSLCGCLSASFVLVVYWLPFPSLSVLPERNISTASKCARLANFRIFSIYIRNLVTVNSPGACW